MSIREDLQNLTLEDPTKVSIGDGDQYKNSAIRRRSLPNVNFIESKSKDVSTEGNISYFFECILIEFYVLYKNC